MAQRTTQKQVTDQLDRIENVLTLPKGILHLQGCYGYWQIVMRTLNSDGSIDSGVRTIASGLTLREISQSLSLMSELMYQSRKTNEQYNEAIARNSAK